MDEIAQAALFGSLILLKLSCRSRVVFTLLGREHIRLTQGKAVLGSEPEKPLKILERHPCTTCCVLPFKSASTQVGRLHAVETDQLRQPGTGECVCGVALLQGLRQHNQRIHALQLRIDQLEERTPNRAHSDLLSQQMGVMQERMDAFSVMRTSATSSLHRIPAGIGKDEALQEHEQDQRRQD